MKRRCPYCNTELKGKKLVKHISETHEGKGSEFYCRDTCVRCCTDPGSPLELLLADIKRISKKLKIGAAEFFERYGAVLWTNIPGTALLIPATGLPFPCKFLVKGKCSIYDVRPLHCRLFPERLYIAPEPWSYESFYSAGYICVDDGLTISPERRSELEELMIEDQRELEKTADFFNNEKFVYELTPDQLAEVEEAFLKISPGDCDRGGAKRRVLDEMIPQDFKEHVRQAFLDMLGETH
ncbi:flagellin N-methylase [archaeon BMS3Bbin16]|nr:flagellin N-methylase [archaeon BMS3Bbin16]